MKILIVMMNKNNDLKIYDYIYIMTNTKNSSSNSSYSDNSDCDSDSGEYVNFIGEVINNKYLILNKLGHGSYCSVWNTYDIDTRQLIALKIYNIDDSDDGINEKKVMDDLKKLNLKNSILYNKFIEFEYNDDKYISFTMDNCGYSLNEIRKLFRDTIRTNIEINYKYMIFINKIKDIIIDILNILHNNNYAHTDIKPENILIDIPRLESKIIYEQIYTIHDKLKKNKNKKILTELSDLTKKINHLDITDNDIIQYLSNFGYNIKLCDFGTCLKFGDDTIYKKHTSYYKSPRIILKYPLTQDYDYWSLACTIYELICGEVLFNPFDENLIDTYDDIEDINLMYLITSTIGMPPIEMINNSKVSDILFTFDRKTVRGHKKIIYNDYLSRLSSVITDNNKHIIHELLNFVIKKLNY